MYLNLLPYPECLPGSDTDTRTPLCDCRLLSSTGKEAQNLTDSTCFTWAIFHSNQCFPFLLPSVAVVPIPQLWNSSFNTAGFLFRTQRATCWAGQFTQYLKPSDFFAVPHSPWLANMVSQGGRPSTCYGNDLQGNNCALKANAWGMLPHWTNAKAGHSSLLYS